MQLRVDGLKISRPLVLGGIRSEAGHTDVDQFVQVFCLLVADILRGLLQVTQTRETTISGLLGVVIVMNLQVTGVTRLVTMKVVRPKWNARILLRVAVVA